MKTDCRVVTISIDVTVNGERLDVSEATISLGVNAIPMISLQCAPSPSGVAKALEPSVSSPTLSDYMGLYRRLSDAAEGLASTGNITISVKEDMGETDEIKLENWVLSDVGMSSVSATEAPFLVVTMQHPICRLTKVGSIYETPLADTQKTIASKIAKCIPGSEAFTAIVDRLYDAVQHDGLWYGTPSKAPKVWRNALVSKEHRPSTYLDDRSGIFLVGTKADKGEKIRMAQAEAMFALPKSDGSSTWDMLLKVPGALLLSIVQDQNNNFTTDKLVLEPTSPWKETTLSLQQNWCYSTEIFGRDPFKLSGVMARKPAPGSDMITEGVSRVGNANNNSAISDVMYVPRPYEENPKIADGRIMKTSSPALLDMMLLADGETGMKLGVASSDTISTRLANYNDLLKKYCKALYELTATSMSVSTATMALYFHDIDGNLILPGNSCVFNADGDKPLYYGYVTKVVHHLSVSGGCSTVVKMAYVRPDADYVVDKNKIAIAMGTANEAYA